MEDRKSIAQDDQRGQAGVPVILVGSRPTRKRGTPDAMREQRIEVTPDGAVKLDVPTAPIFKLVSGLLTGSAAAVFTAKSRYTNVQIIVASVDNTASYTFTLYHLTGTESAGDSTSIGKAVDMPAGCDPIAYTGLGLEKGDVIQGLASTASKLNVTVYGTPLGV